VETCHPKSGPAEDRQGALRHGDADIMQESVYLPLLYQMVLLVLSMDLLVLVKMLSAP
jgi:hypothetical protein